MVCIMHCMFRHGVRTPVGPNTRSKLKRQRGTGESSILRTHVIVDRGSKVTTIDKQAQPSPAAR